MLFLKQHQEKLIKKMKNLEEAYRELIFQKVCRVPAKLIECTDHYRSAPQGDYRDIAEGEVWGGEDKTGWFKCEFTVPTELDGQKLFISANAGTPESLLFINGMPQGLFAAKYGNHHTLLLTQKAKEGEVFKIDIESYCSINIAECMPYEKFSTASKAATFHGIVISIMHEAIKDFVYNLRAVNQIISASKNEYRVADFLVCLENVSQSVYLMPHEHSLEKVLKKVEEGNKFLSEELNKKGDTANGYIGLIGHSHMDTAWLWPIKETIRKCARTYANALSLMNQYPEYTFIQSSAYHSELMKRHYPLIWEEMKKQIANGRYEPNGGVWIECDCNIPSGESIIRQFLWGQKFYEKNCNYRADTFWLPDTFGYSAALPQILIGCGIKYFTTTKLSWNDTNKFPYNTFVWRGNDGSEVIAHFNMTHCEPGLDQLILAANDWNSQKGSADGRLISFGIGDGGGGPSYDWIEIARRAMNADVCPKAEHTSVSKYMDRIAQNKHKLPMYSGELYLELHRGTLTSIHENKRNNRLAEFKLRSLEILHSMLNKDNAQIDGLYETTLINQFHDILPGTSIPSVNDTAISEMKDVLKTADALIRDDLRELTQDGEYMAFFNPMSWENSSFYIDDTDEVPEKSSYQSIENVFGEKKLYLENVPLPPASVKSFKAQKKVHGSCTDCSGSQIHTNAIFSFEGKQLSTPLYHVEFGEKFEITSLILKCSGRELVRKNSLGINTFLIGQDVPYEWDNWDIEYETIQSLKPDYRLINSEIAACGQLQFRIRNTYRIGESSTIYQDIVFYANKEQIDFETQIDWNEKHMLLKAGFDFDLLVNYARHEIQFGFAERPTFKRNSFEQAMFEVSNHKYSDFSETHFGVALLNDCKYGISVDGTNIGLTLMKSGTHPDIRGDQGIHRMSYAILPHGGFSAINVVKPAYAFNTEVKALQDVKEIQIQILTAEKPNIVVEAIKPAYDGNGIIVRLYECEKTAVKSLINAIGFEKAYLTNMLEEDIKEIDLTQPLDFRAFEIKTLRLLKSST